MFWAWIFLQGKLSTNTIWCQQAIPVISKHKWMLERAIECAFEWTDVRNIYIYSGCLWHGHSGWGILQLDYHAANPSREEAAFEHTRIYYWTKNILRFLDMFDFGLTSPSCPNINNAVILINDDHSDLSFFGKQYRGSGRRTGITTIFPRWALHVSKITSIWTTHVPWENWPS